MERQMNATGCVIIGNARAVGLAVICRYYRLVEVA